MSSRADLNKALSAAGLSEAAESDWISRWEQAEDKDAVIAEVGKSKPKAKTSSPKKKSKAE
tara:strand:+ start:15270 stop:15452 length:183 start_codon:yes stop_codon:yes gene_type:complete